MPSDRETRVVIATCFRLPGRIDAARFAPARIGGLDLAAAMALADLLPLLGCGEEAAALAFDELSLGAADDLSGRALRAIAGEERVHDALLKRLAHALPEPKSAESALRAARRFHIDLGLGGVDLQFAKIAAIDASVCTVLGRLLRRGGPASSDETVRFTLARIRRDEARHVAVSRRLSLARGVSVAARDAAVAARGALAGILRLGGDAFDALGVDPDRLVRDVARLPAGLLSA